MNFCATPSLIWDHSQKPLAVERIMNTKTSFKQLKYYFKKQLNVLVNDVQSCKEAMQHKDCKCITYNIDSDMLSLKTKAFLAAKRFGYNPRLRVTSYLFCNLPSHQKKDFHAFYNQFTNEHLEEVSNALDSNILQLWQKSVTKRLINRNDRQVLFVFDVEGNTGKSSM